MKKLLFALAIFIISFNSCTSVKEIGKLNMVSNRNVDPDLKYKLITTYSGGSEKELKKSKFISIEQAIDNTIKKTPGGEFLMNAKIYLVDNKYIAVEGDIWGIEGFASYKGFKVGDKVTWKTSLIKGKDYITGTITSLKDDKECLIKIDNQDKITEVEYTKLSKQ